MTVPPRAALAVLVVDDHEPFRRAVVTMLGLDDRYVVVAEASDGERAVELAAALRPAVVLMDVRLPGIDGVEATRRIMAHDPGVAVVLVSTQAAAELPLGYDTCGAVAFCPKESLDLAMLQRLLPA